uniref:Uncharacterized protein n=1 Tax=Anguilla anguilla TaxID=7936 RepID=A0A0E9T550_ANGAN
MFQGSYICI